MSAVLLFGYGRIYIKVEKICKKKERMKKNVCVEKKSGKINNLSIYWSKFVNML